MADHDVQFLQASTQSMGLSLSDTQLRQLVGYVDLLEKWNRTYNLTAIRNRQEILVRHVLESLAVLPFIQGSQRLDVGTGAGIPGIPLAIVDTDSRYTLLDSNGKKTRFLAEVKRQLGLTTIQIKTARVESWTPDGAYDALVTRAFADLRTTLDRIDHVFGNDGSLYTMTTDSAAEISTVMPDTMRLGAVHEISVPGQDWSFNLIKIQRSHGEAL